MRIGWLKLTKQITTNQKFFASCTTRFNSVPFGLRVAPDPFKYTLNAVLSVSKWQLSWWSLENKFSSHNFYDCIHRILERNCRSAMKPCRLESSEMKASQREHWLMWEYSMDTQVEIGWLHMKRWLWRKATVEHIGIEIDHQFVQHIPEDSPIFACIAVPSLTQIKKGTEKGRYVRAKRTQCIRNLIRKVSIGIGACATSKDATIIAKFRCLHQEGWLCLVEKSASDLLAQALSLRKQNFNIKPQKYLPVRCTFVLLWI